jgi:flavin-binding protein dodecin
MPSYTGKSSHDRQEEKTMSDQNHVYKLVELVGSSEVGVDDAIRNAIEQANQSLRHVDWFEATEIRGHVADGKIAHYQVKLKVGFRLES